MKKFVFAIGLILANAASYGGYELHQLADSTSLDSPELSSIALNNEGQVAVFAGVSIYTMAVGIDPSELYGPEIARPNGDSLHSTSTELNINDFGEVVFEAETFLESAGIYSGNGGALAEHIYSDSGYFMSPSINNLGNVAFVGDPAGSSGSAFISDGVSVTPIGNPQVTSFNAEVNEANHVVLFGYSDHSVIYTDEGVIIAEEFDSILALYGNVTWNSSGLVVFSALTENGRALFTSNGEVTTLIAEGVLLGGAAINESGDIAFVDRITDTLYFFNNSNDTVVPIVGNGDAIGDRVVASLSFGRHGFNDSREIAFGIGFSNGDRGVYLAHPVPVPAAIGLFLSALGLFRMSCKPAY